ncbi:triose-phosphate isomerase [Deinococcus sp. KNUC1210]|uniref:triose-phosphate isomerase n=1 Tax=Deinococcus sp. KNUC1210 TaxID=2917691 RepID=UPI001EEFC0C3|nr:triose-phosphate isomerase [Deinococcus sp. KNUC1210]ULH16201.1 triose-phosphate isomerase [Deinococcus sp. KNUC1210]
MNKTPSEATAWANDLKAKLQLGEAEVAIMAPAIDLQALSWFLKDTGVNIGGQDVSQHESGAYTGEISAGMLKDVGAKYAVVGHSERREYHAESSQIVAAKARAALAAGLIPIICVGEGLEVRERGEHVSYTLDQLRDSLAGITITSAEQLVIAYEPVWAIGTGKTATALDAEELCAAIRSALSGLLGEVGAGVQVLYGGSVKGSNIREICGQPNVNGALVGGASLEVQGVLDMVNALK